jgi:hypothetical protein
MTLLDAPSTPLVLIVGVQLERWRSVFPESRFVETLNDIQETAEFYDLIIYHCESVATREELEKELSDLHGMLRPTGHLLLYALNAYSLRALKKVREGSLFRTLRCGRKGYRKSLVRAGFAGIYEYLALPTLEAAEEMVATGSRFLELPHYWHPLFHLAQRLGLFPSIADGYMFIAGNRSLEEGRLLRTVARLMSSAGGQSVDRCTLERFDLRLRGALVLFMKNHKTGQHVVVRVVSDPETREIISRNQGFLTDLQASLDLPANIRVLLPRPMGECRVGDSDIYVESLLEGVLAWKVNRARLRKRIQAEAAEFIFQFQYGTRRKVRLDTPELNELFDVDLARLEGCHEVNPNLQKTVAETVDKIRQSLYGREVFLTASHGDYGYGNILVDARTSELKGVIDWDTGRVRDLPGIDYLNMEVQRIRIESGCELSTAFRSVAANTLKCGSLDLKYNYQQYLAVTSDLLPELISLALIRYVTRSVQYPEVFSPEQSQYIDAFETLSRTAPF